MPKPSNKQRVINCFDSQDEGIRYFFDQLPDIINHVYSPEPALAYCFQRMESGQRVALYVLLMRKFRTDATVAWAVVDGMDITRKSFPEHYETLAGTAIGGGVTGLLTEAVKVRDRITHGKQAQTSDVLGAVIACLGYAAALNKQVRSDAGFAPFGRLQGVTSSRRPQLDKDISRLVIKGLGLA
jgi:hypothetical protein